jgi:hypothetical protein
VTITWHGKRVVELRAAEGGDAGRWSPELIDEIAARAKSLPTFRGKRCGYCSAHARQVSVTICADTSVLVAFAFDAPESDRVRD